MNIIFYAKKSAFSSSQAILDRILKEKLNITDYKIVKSDTGKPFLELNNPLLAQIFISITHTKSAYFIAISNQNVGIDAEEKNRTPNYLPILEKFSKSEREEIKTTKDFLIHWTVKESVIKWLGGTLSQDLKRLSYTNKKLTLCGLELPVAIYQKEFFSHFLTVCSEKDVEWEIVSL